jgi:hypothetical protein
MMRTNPARVLHRPFQAVGWNAMFAPKGTPKDIVQRTNTVTRETSGCW